MLERTTAKQAAVAKNISGHKHMKIIDSVTRLEEKAPWVLLEIGLQSLDMRKTRQRDPKRGRNTWFSALTEHKNLCQL